MGAFRVTGALAVAGLAVTGAVTAIVTTGSRARFDDLVIVLAVAAYAAVGTAVELARPGHWVGRLMLLGSAAWGIGEGLIAVGLAGLAEHPDSTTYAVVGVLGTAARGLAWLVLVLALPLVFPDGRSPSRAATALVTTSIATFTAGLLLAPTPLEDRMDTVDNPVGLPESWQVLADLMAIGGLALAFVSLAVVVVALVHRWRAGGERLRQQVLVFGVAFALPLLVLPIAASPLSRPWMFALATLPVPLAVAVAMFQRRLYDVQLAVSRTLTYVALSAVLAGIYALVVLGVGVLLQDRGAAWLPLAGAAVVAVAFAPLRETLQGAVNRMTYGRWSSPATVLADTGRRLADAADAPGLLESLTDEMVHGLGFRHAEIRDHSGTTLAATGDPQEVTERLALTAYGSPVGELRWAGPPLRAADRALLDALSHQIGGAVHTAGLVEELRGAQERLVLAREQERRRLRSDLHDGLGPSLAGLAFQLDAVQNRMESGLSVDGRLVRLRAGLGETVLEVRRIVEGLRPALIDDLGLFGAVTELGHGLADGCEIDLEVDLPEQRPSLPAAVEVAAYRVAQEALTNVVRHSGASRCTITGTITEGFLVLDVTDDGRGGAEPGTGLGIPSMRDRARQIGGDVQIAARHPGTSVTARLPIDEGVPT